MSQYDFGTINPTTKSGTDLASDLNSWRDAVKSSNSGASRPSYAVAGSVWRDTGDAKLYHYNGTADEMIPKGATVYGESIVQSADASAARTVLALGDASTAGFLDEDDMSSDSDTDAPSQQSVKSFVDGKTQLLHVKDEQTSGTSGGTISSGSWLQRGINTVDTNEISGSSLASSQITLPAGTYFVHGTVPAFRVSLNQSRLYDTTGSATLVNGTSVVASDANVGFSNSIIMGRFTLSVESVLEVQHQVAVTRSVDGRGVASNFGEPEVYTNISIWRAE